MVMHLNFYILKMHTILIIALCITDGGALFRAFLSREFSDENIEFWIACEEFKKVRQSKMPSKARKIYDDFLAVRAPKEVNVT